MRLNTLLSRWIPLVLIAMFLFTESSCKYEDGPLIAFRSREKRVINSWNYELALRNGLNVTAGQADFSINYLMSSIGFDDRNRFTTILNYTSTDTAYTAQHDGSWAFIEDDQKILLTYDTPYPVSGETQVWIITRLKEKAFWMEEELGANLYQYRLTCN